MTSVTCNACSQIIATENDRVYCFGGCEQILHIRCSELRPSDSAALRNNIALKYMCFACRKKQICLNDLQTKCTELLEKINDVCENVAKHESCLDQLENRLLEKIESSLMPSLIRKIEARIATRGANNDHASYASVARSTEKPAVINDPAAAKVSNPSVSSVTVLEDDEEGSTLRSGRRRNITRPAASPAVNEKTRTSKESSDSQQLNRRKPSSNQQVGTPTPAKKFAQTVVIKPKESQQADVTQKHVRDKIDPTDFSVKGIRSKENGNVVVECATSDHAQKLVSAAAEALSDDYEISIQKPLRPRIKIIGLSENRSASELIPALKKQNGLPPASDITLIRTRKVEKWKKFPFIAVLETDAQTFELLMQRRRINVRWDRCRIAEEINVFRCFNCSKYGHTASSCENPLCCPVCAGDHDVGECDASFEKCINCEQRNKQRKSPYDKLLSINHSAWSPDCPVYQKRLKDVRQMVDYSA